MARGDSTRWRLLRKLDKSEISVFIKYLVFSFNVLFWVLGLACCAAGLYAWYEKGTLANFNRLVAFDPALFLIIIGTVMFVLGFAGCVGALRENTCLLRFFSYVITFMLLVQIVIGILFYLFMDRIKDKEHLTKLITEYRDDDDLKNFIDWIQGDWLHCCGLERPRDWEANQYFNCSSPPPENCGVPPSCCKNQTEGDLNHFCGHGMLDDDKLKEEGLTAGDRIYTTGCLKLGEDWVRGHVVEIVAGVGGAVLVQILGIAFADTLRRDIIAQMASWR